MWNYFIRGELEVAMDCVRSGLCRVKEEKSDNLIITTWIDKRVNPFMHEQA